MPNTKLIVKNTIALYIRSFISLVLSLWTARLVLANLGIEDYGVYNAVGGIVSMVAFIQGSMAGATQRFLSYYIGLGDSKRLKEVFSMSVNVHLIISIVLVIAIEIFGAWYLPNKLNYGAVDYSVVKLIFHTSVASLFFMFNSIPFNSMLIAKESMSAFAYIDILQRLLKFCLAYSLIFFRKFPSTCLWGQAPKLSFGAWPQRRSTISTSFSASDAYSPNIMFFHMAYITIFSS